MNQERKTNWILGGLTVVFTFLTVGFLAELWGRPVPLPSIPLVDESFIDPAPVRMSAAELIRADGDTSGFNCYACHEEGKKIELKFDDEGDVIVPEDHDDIVFRHGRHGRNNHCFNCHHPEAMDHLHLRTGQKLSFAQSNLLCASCHGPTYRDWEVGIHGRVSGYWDRSRGEAVRLDCTSCHDPHAPAFPALPPAPGPVPLHAKDRQLIEFLKGDPHARKR